MTAAGKDRSSGEYRGPGLQGIVLSESPRSRITLLGAGNGTDREGSSGGPEIPTVLKEYLGPHAGRRFRRERAALQRLDGTDGVPRILGLSDMYDTAVRESYAGPRALREFVRPGGIPVGTVLDLAIGIVSALVGIHRAGVIHRDLNPANIVLDEDDARVTVIDFDLSAIYDESVGPAASGDVLGVPAYTSPEQTGRTGSPVDHRSDLYTLGITLYELVTGTVPFPDQDPLSLVHDHLATLPRTLHEVVPETPRVLSAIVGRLLAKEPEARYQSAEGLLHDLNELRARLVPGQGDTSAGHPVELGRFDFPRRLSFPARLIGRDREQQILTEALVRASQESRGLLLIAGPAGTGKTSLAESLRHLVAAGRGRYLGGKFDQYRKDTVGDGLLTAFAALGRILLAEPEDTVRRTRSRLREAMGENLNLLLHVPEFAALLQEEPSSLFKDVEMLEERTGQGAAVLLGQVASPQRPIVLVLDDLHWAVPHTVKMITRILTQDRSPGLLVVGTYRTEAVVPGHPVQQMISTCNRAGVPLTEIELTDLSRKDLVTLLQGMLKLDAERGTALAGPVHARTGGNPFETLELLNALRQEEILVLSPTGWEWEGSAIRSFIGAGDALSLVNERLGRLPAGTVEVLRAMACLGGAVSMSLLASACALSPDDLSAVLDPALQDGLLLPVETPGREDEDRIRFRHDRVHEAVHDGMPDELRRRTHLFLARRLAEDPDQEDEAAAQYLHVVEMLQDPLERQRAAALFTTAADAEDQFDNYTQAERYADAARRLTPSPARGGDEQIWATRFARHHGALFHVGRLDEADAVYQQVVEERGPEAVPIGLVCVQLSSLNARSRSREALAAGLEQLERLGVPPPPVDLRQELLARFGELTDWVEGLDPRTDAARPPADDPNTVAVAQVMNRLSVPAYFIDPLLSAWLVTEAVRLWREYGPYPDLVPAIAYAASAAVTIAENYSLGYKLVRHLLDVSEAKGYERWAAYARFVYTVSACHWHEPLEMCVPQTRQARRVLLRSGDLQEACATYYTSLVFVFQYAPTLDAVLEEAEEALALCERIGNRQACRCLGAIAHLARMLRGECGPPNRWHEELRAGRSGSDVPQDDHVINAYLHLYRGILALLLQDDRMLAEELRDILSSPDAPSGVSRPYGYSLPGVHHSALSALQRGLLLARSLRTAEPARRGDIETELEPVVRFLRERAADQPDNYRQMHLMVEGERAWALGRPHQAVQFFDEALNHLDSHSRPWQRAILTRRAGELDLELGRRRSALDLFVDYRRTLSQWGAVALVNDLDRLHPEIRARDLHTTDRGARRGQWSSSHSMGSGSSSLSIDDVDLLAILRASQALASQQSLDDLMEIIVRVLTELTGATDVQLLVRHEETPEWVLLTTAIRGGAPVGLSAATSSGQVTGSAVLFADRMGTEVLVSDVCTDPRFAQDRRPASLEQCSLMAIPVTSHGRTWAMLILENRLRRDAFTSDRLDAVQLIAGQLAVSLENALTERFRSLVQHSSDVTLVCTRDGILTYASLAAVDLFGVRAVTAMVGRPVREILPGADELLREETTALSWEEPAGGVGDGSRTPWGSLQCAITRRDGTPVWTEITFTDFSTDPAVGGVVLHLRDITERRELEAELRHAQKMESLGQLAAGIAHEINTPIQFIGNNVSFLTEVFDDLTSTLLAFRGMGEPRALAEADLGPWRAANDLAGRTGLQELVTDVPAALNETAEGVDRVARIVRAMKSSVHPGGDDAVLTDLNEVVRNTLIMANSELKYIADLRMELGDVPQVMCYTGDVNQVLLNLVVNAAQAIEEKLNAQQGPKAGNGQADQALRGTITVRSRSEGDDVLIDVEDTGIGIDPSIEHRVFEQFFTTKPVGVGSGQGLALAYYLIHDRSKGSITFTSRQGVGTNFTVRLPVAGPRAG
jgi:PAS domain S-box-containing protein